MQVTVRIRILVSEVQSRGTIVRRKTGEACDDKTENCKEAYKSFRLANPGSETRLVFRSIDESPAMNLGSPLNLLDRWIRHL